MNNTVYENGGITIMQTAENRYRAITDTTDIEMEVELIDEYRTAIKAVYCKEKRYQGNGKWSDKFYKSKKEMVDHCERWFLYQLEENGIIRKRKVIGG